MVSLSIVRRSAISLVGSCGATPDATADPDALGTADATDPPCPVSPVVLCGLAPDDLRDERVVASSIVTSPAVPVCAPAAVLASPPK
jgi:hypothetical protein